MTDNIVPYIQFMAAIYVTMSIDNIICRRFWSPDYYKMLNDTIGTLEISQTVRIQGSFYDSAHNKFREKDEQSHKTGALMLFCTMTLMITYSFCDTDINIITSDIPLISFLLYILLLYFTISFFRWSFLIFSIIILSIGYISLHAIQIENSIINNDIYLNWIIVICVTLPFIRQLFLNWISSIIYIRYLNVQFNKEQDLYLKAKNAFDTNSKDKLPKEYEEVAIDIGINNINEGDEQTTKLNELLVKRLIKISTSANIFKLLKSYFKYNKKRNTKNVQPTLEDEDQEISDIPTVYTPVQEPNKSISTHLKEDINNNDITNIKRIQKKKKRK